jgi:high-affinity Fe2+/Pb2+ permease
LVFFAAGMVAYGTHEVHEYLEEAEHSSNRSYQMAEAGNDINLNDATTSYEEEEENVAYSIFENKIGQDDPSAFWYKKVGDEYIHILNDKGSIGSFLKGLFGYNSNPIWIEVILWFLSLSAGLFFWHKAYKN